MDLYDITNKIQIECIVDNHHGIYIPMVYWQKFGHATMDAPCPEDREIMDRLVSEWEDGNDSAIEENNIDYWEIWESILFHGKLKNDKGELFFLVIGFGAGDVFAVRQTDYDNLSETEKEVFNEQF